MSLHSCGHRFSTLLNGDQLGSELYLNAAPTQMIAKDMLCEALPKA